MNTIKKSEQEKMFDLVEKCLASKISTKAFCKSQGLAEHIYYYWQRKYRLQPTHARFVPLEINHIPDFISAEITLTYPNGISIKLTGGINVSMLRTLVQIN